MRNPLSAMISSPGSSKGGTPLILVISLTEMHPVCRGETNVTKPLGATPSPFNVVLFLQFKNVSDCKVRDEAVSRSISVQSSITRHWDSTFGI